MPKSTPETQSVKKAVVCQLARLGDLAQTLPLLRTLSQNHYVKLICDRAVLDWTSSLPGVDDVATLDSRTWRKLSSGELVEFPRLLNDLQAEMAALANGGQMDFYALNDHPVSDALAGALNLAAPQAWVSPRLILVRSYIRLISRLRRINRLHLSDLWVALSSDPPVFATQPLRLNPAGTQFARTVLSSLDRRKIGQIWALALGSGAKSRRLEPEDYASWWQAIPTTQRPGIVLIGGRGEEELAQRFLHCARGLSPGVLNLVGQCSPQELLSVMSELDLVMGVDTGPLHWAAALGTPVLGFYFGEAGFYETGPYGEGHWVIAPDCPDYPCLPNRAHQCDWLCRQAFKNASQMAELLLPFTNPTSITTFSPVLELRLYKSYLSLDGNSYRPMDGSQDSPEVERFAQLARRVLHLHHGNGHSSAGMETESSLRQLGIYCTAWQSEIEQLPCPAAMPLAVFREAQIKATEALEACSPVPDSRSGPWHETPEVLA